MTFQNQGVFIFVLLFKEIEMTLNINSFYTKKILSKLHPNIQVLRHPDHLKRRVLLWSHHEKMVIVDQKIALLGGIDLCYGRWDTHQHPIQDVSKTLRNEKSVILDVHLDQLIHDPCQMQTADCVFHSKLKSLKWSYVSDEKMKWSTNFTRLFSNINNCSGYQLADLQFNNYYKTLNIIHKDKFSTSAMIPCSGWTAYRYKKMKDFSHNPNFIHQIKSISGKCLHSKIKPIDNQSNADGETQIAPKSLFLGKDYVNWIVKDIKNLDKPDIDLIDRQSIPRMPWHDIGCIVYGRCARDLARHFIQRWNAVKKEKSGKDKKYCMLLPKCYSRSEIQKMSIVSCSLTTCQVLRSVAKWSVNINSTENSILNAYIETIRKAKHYIYIENQFFISSTSQEPDIIKNQISKEILERIIYFHSKSKTFRVFIILPLLPAFETESEGFKSAALYTVLHYIYRSLFRGSNSLFENLIKLQIDPYKYIFIGSLRNYGFLGDKLFTEQIYVHSKLLIVDDKYSIIGSANLNDRSMLGYRDSEVAFYFEDEYLENSKFNNESVEVGFFCSKLRKALMSEHLGIHGILDADDLFFNIQLLNDPIQDAFFVDVWCKTARKNTELFDEIFCCIPTDQINNLSNFTKVKLQSSLSYTNPDLAKERVKLIQGHLVTYPTKFLVDESLEPSFATRERMVPIETWL